MVKKILILHEQGSASLTHFIYYVLYDVALSDVTLSIIIVCVCMCVLEETQNSYNFLIVHCNQLFYCEICF